MRLLTGPAGSGKTSRVLLEFRDALIANRANVRLLVPTATLSEHLRNELARDGAVFPAKCVSTLARFAEELAPGVPIVSSAHFHLMVEDAVLRLNRPELEQVRDLAGVHARIARTLADLDAAGATPRHLARVRRDLAPSRDALVAIWEDVERQLCKRGNSSKRAQFCTITNDIQRDLFPAHVWVDGFAQLSPPEIELLCAIGKHSTMTLTLPDEGVSPSLKETLLTHGFQEERLTGHRAPQETFVKPETADREVEEIARRILEAAEAGTPLREMGVILRQPSKYVPLLRAAFERFGIPAHFYFGQPLALHLAGKLFSGAIEGLLAGWDYEQTLELLRLIPITGASNNLDSLELTIRAIMPGNGLDGLARQASGRALHRVFRQLRSLERWLTEWHSPDRWAAEFELLPALLWPGYIDDRLAPELVAQYRDQAAGMRAFNEAIQSAAAWWGTSSNPIPLSEFWRVAKTLIRLTNVVPRNLSRNVVYVVDAFEARQWDFSIAFVCGLIEKDFPAQNGRDPFLPDAALHDLARLGIRARTAADKDAEEFGLFEAVRARARHQLVLTCPRLDARGQPALPSIFLKGREPGAMAPAVRPALPPPVALVRRLVSIRSSDLLQILTEQQTRISVSNLESLLQCPFQFFARRALRIAEFPVRPEDRLNFLLQGNIAHEVLRDWFLQRPDLDTLFARVFDRVCAEKHVRPGFRTEHLRRAMQLSLHCFGKDAKYPRPASSQLEQLFEYAIGDLTITGRLDRIDRLENGSWVVVDYKFSTAANTKDRVDDESKLQGPLYALALHRVFGQHPSAMVYASLKDKVQYYGWGSVPDVKLDAITPGWMELALDRVLKAVAEFRGGVIHPRPMNDGPCRYCDYRDACRVEQPMTLAGSGA